MSQSATDLTASRVAAIIATCAWEPCSTTFGLRLRANRQHDFIVQNHGTIWTFRARSPGAQAWWVENVGDGPCLGRNWCVEHRFAREILDGLRRDGFIAVSGRAR
jgi:hypothetical protein